MRTTTLGFGLITCVLGVLLPRVELAGRTADTVPVGAIPQINIMVGPIGPGGGPGISIGNQLVAGQPQTSYISSGVSGFPELCAVSGGQQTDDAASGPPPGAIVEWRFVSRLKSYDRSRAVIDLHWTRTVHDRSLVDGESIERHYELTLYERVRTILDLVRPEGGPQKECDGIALEAELSFVDDVELASRLLEYDIWLVQTDASGKQVTDHVHPRSFQGKQVEYVFRPLRYTPDGSLASDGAVSVRLDGRVKGRVRPDGRIDLVLSATRYVVVGRLGHGNGGTKEETVEDGETIEFRTPGLRGSIDGIPQDSSLLRDGQTAIRVTVRRIS